MRKPLSSGMRSLPMGMTKYKTLKTSLLYSKSSSYASQNSPEGSTTRSMTGDLFDTGNIETDDIFAYDPPEQSPILMMNRPSSPLPRSSPWTSDSLLAEPDTILEFDTSPRAPPSPIAGWPDSQSTAFSHYMHRPRQTRLGFRTSEHCNWPHRTPTSENSHSSSIISLNPFPLKPAFPNPRLSSNFTLHNAQPPSPVLSAEGRPKTSVLSDLPLDFLSDPNPWKTIGMILQLEPSLDSSCTVSGDEQVVDYTKEREGVGYTQGEQGPFNLASVSSVPYQKSIETNSSQQPVQDSSLLPGVTAITSFPCSDTQTIVHQWSDGDFSQSNSNSPNNRDNLCASSQSRPSSPAEPDYIAVEDSEYDAEIGTVEVFDPDPWEVQPESTRHVPDTRMREVDMEMCFDGPCLFRNSDFEDE